MVIGEETRRRLLGERARYPESRGALLAALHRVQEENGHISASMMDELASLLDLRPGEVLAFVRFHPDFRERQGKRHRIALCRGVSCALRGAAQLERELEALRAAAPTESSWDLDSVDCLGACDCAPALSVDRELMGPATVLSVREALAALE
jgi:NADH:ubiquinone oxidoreductase subunit E